MHASGSNAEQIEYWNGEAGAKWVALQERLDGQIGPLGELALAAAELVPGERVLDVGCGCGATTLEIARRVGSAGSVLGVDLSEPMLARARERAAAAGLSSLRFTPADAQAFPFEAGSVDVVLSRFGVMFFSDPSRAFANLCRALSPGGRLAFVCWQPLDANPWMRIPVVAVAPFVQLPPPPAPDEPGPFSFGDPKRVLRILSEAGFADASVQGVESALSVGGGGDLEQVVDFMLHIGPTGRLLAESTPEQVSKAREAIREALTPFATPEGVEMDCGVWIVTARRP